LSGLAKSLKSADRLPDATLDVDGHAISCYVVRVQSSDQKRVPSGYSFDKTIWIDKNRETVLKIVEHAHNHVLVPGAAGIPIEEEITTALANTDLNGPVRDSLFSFIPPSDAKLIQEFPDPLKSLSGTNITGEQVPSLKLKSADGKVVSLDSFRGKPVLIDFWATWCYPCVAALPQLAKIYQEGRDKGLIMLSIDRDEEAKTATDFLSKKGYTWPDFHDDGDIEKLMGPSGIPRTVLVDAQGKIVYDAIAPNDDQLRTEIAKLGPEYVSLLPKQAPCVASK
jgi:thiol-disulfide isomerase/thioredoxin